MYAPTGYFISIWWIQYSFFIFFHSPLTIYNLITLLPLVLKSNSSLHTSLSLPLSFKITHSLKLLQTKKNQISIYKIKNGKQSTSDIKESVEYGTCSFLHVEKRHVKGQTNDGPKHDAQTPQQARWKSHCQSNVPPSQPPQPRQLLLKSLS